VDLNYFKKAISITDLTNSWGVPTPQNARSLLPFLCSIF